ncbi:hypothetical protein ED733_002943 [Metarhizium rileyi]|uniref:Uncharacterized protein n=1 Tax=Metarhizium rileyi (strain RCEF 4871) TaxID=1649241 RepID=A0A5C6G4P6_METRR|nr:hypothetical protein ED733_002943 [Metarhizium rileyi]
MKSTIVITILAACVATWEYPNCEHDNFYRTLIKEALQDEASSVCFDWLAKTVTVPPSIPAEFNNCDARAASSACPCIIYWMSASTSTINKNPHTNPPTVVMTTTKQLLRTATANTERPRTISSTVHVPPIMAISTGRLQTSQSTCTTLTTQNTHTTKQSTCTTYSIKPRTVTNTERCRTAISTSPTSPVITFTTKGPPTTNTTQNTQATQAAHNAKAINCDISTTYRIEIHATQPHATSSCFGQSGCPVGSITITPYHPGAATVRRKVSAISVGSNIVALRGCKFVYSLLCLFPYTAATQAP